MSLFQPSTPGSLSVNRCDCLSHVGSEVGDPIVQEQAAGPGPYLRKFYRERTPKAQCKEALTLSALCSLAAMLFGYGVSRAGK